EADHVVLACEDADLRDVELAVVNGKAQDQEDLIVVDLELRALTLVQHVLERELVQAELRAELAERRRIRAAVDLNPRPTVALEVRLALLGDELALGVRVARVVDEPDRQRAVRLGRALDERAGRRAGRVVGFHPHRRLSLTGKWCQTPFARKSGSEPVFSWKSGSEHCCPTSGSEKGLVHFVGYN